ncbi:MAG: CsgG/HfaB family protein [Acidobacteriota bacterium]
MVSKSKPLFTRRGAAQLCCLVIGVLVATAALGDTWLQRKYKKARTSGQSAYEPSGHWEAFFRDPKDGHTFALEEPVEQHKDRDWLGLEFTDFEGAKTRIAIMPVENRNGIFREVPLDSIEELVGTAIFNTNRFEVVEREEVMSLLAEQDFGTTGRVAKPSAAKIGKILGARYMIFVSVNEWTPMRKNYGGMGAGKKIAEVAMSFRIVDVETSKRVFDDLFRSTAGSWGFRMRLPTFGLDRLGNRTASTTQVTPITYALVSCINKASYAIAAALKDVPWRGTVARVAGNTLTLNRGAAHGVENGMLLDVLGKGEEIRDPDTGLSLGAETDVIGTVRVSSVDDLFSRALILKGCEGVKVGDTVEFKDGASTPGRSVTASAAAGSE